jgi:putative transcriptional regulator
MTGVPRHLTILILALGLAMVDTEAAYVPRAVQEAAPGLTGQFLVARDEIRDPRFHHVVIYMVYHDAAGAMGLVVNRPRTEAPLTPLLKRFGRDVEGVGGTIRVHYGGPVEPGKGFVLHTSDWTIAESQTVRDGVTLTTDPAILEAIARGTGPRRALFALGYTGWGPGQLDGEITRGDWISVPADEELIFDDDARSKWERAMARRKITL